MNIAWDCAEGELGREGGSSHPEPNGQKYLRKDERKHKWDLAAGQRRSFFAQWSIAASGACAVLLHHTQSRTTFLRGILGHALRNRMVMCVLLYAAPTLASSFSNSPLSTTLSTPVLCPQARDMLQDQPSNCKTFPAKPTQSLSKRCCHWVLQSCL